MDLLEQYKQQNPEKFREKKPAPMADPYGREYSTLVALVMRLSSGRIKDARQASYALAVTAGVIAIAALFFFYQTLGTTIDTTKNFVPAETPVK